MPGWVLPRPYQNCSPEEKLRRCKVSYVNGSMTIEKFEEEVEKALKEEQEWDTRKI